jgi:predicted lipid-binding transport protein (Tim44 family)
MMGTYLEIARVLGRRTGNERRPESFSRPAERAGDKAGSNVVPLGVRGPVSQPPLPTTKPGDAVAAGIERLRSADPGFDPAVFLEGARTAFEMIVAAFAAGDRMRLRPLLSDEVYKPFSDTIDERSTAAASPEIPAPLVEQLAPGGRMVIPLGDRAKQTLTLVRREGDELLTSTVADVRFVPLLGEFGFR